MRPHVNAFVTDTTIIEAVTDQILGIRHDTDDVPAAIVGALTDLLGRDMSILGGDFWSAELHLGSLAEYDIVDLDTGDTLDPNELDLDDIRNVETTLVSDHLDDVVTHTLRRLNEDRVCPVVPVSVLDQVGPDRPAIHNWTDDEIERFIDMYATAARWPGPAVVALQCVDHGHDAAFSLVVTDTDGTSTYRCDGFLAPAAQVAAAATHHQQTHKARRDNHRPVRT